MSTTSKLLICHPQEISAISPSMLSHFTHVQSVLSVQPVQSGSQPSQASPSSPSSLSCQSSPFHPSSLSYSPFLHLIAAAQPPPASPGRSQSKSINHHQVYQHVTIKIPVSQPQHSSQEVQRFLLKSPSHSPCKSPHHQQHIPGHSH